MPERSLNELSKYYLEHHQPKTALFYAEKIIPQTLVSVLLQCQCYLRLGESRKILTLLDGYLEDESRGKEGQIDLDYTDDEKLDIYLYKCEAYYRIAKFAEVVENTISNESLLAMCQRSHESKKTQCSRLCLLRAKCYDELENKKEALHFYKLALEYDNHSFEAFDAFRSSQIISNVELAKFVRGLHNLNEYTRLSYLSVLDSSVLQIIEQKYPDLYLSIDIQCQKAKYLLSKQEHEECLQITKPIIDDDPFTNSELLYIHLACLAQFKKKEELFYLGHQLVDANPERAEAWYCIGLYYFTCGNLGQAEKYLTKASKIDSHQLDIWISLGHVHSEKDDCEQALNAYRTAHRLFPGDHSSLLYIGMEYVKSNNINIAEQFVMQSKSLCQTDPLIFNELGVIRYKQQQYENALQFFTQALELQQHKQRESLDISWEPIYSNIAHCHRKLGHYSKALQYYEQALALKPTNGSTYCALGFTHHLQGHLEEAIEYYHKAMSLRFEDQHFIAEALSKALQSYQVSSNLLDF